MTNIEDTRINIDALKEHSDDELIDFILERFHARHREQLEALIEDADKVCRVHADHALRPVGLALLLKATSEDLQNHMFKEENILFPMIKRGQGAMAFGPISVMKSEHEGHMDTINELESLTRDEVRPSDACGTWRRLFDGVHELVTDLKQHIEIENEILFARQI